MGFTKLQAPELDEAICFKVANLDESDPNEAGELTVTMDPSRVSVYFTGASKERWEATWTEFRFLLRRIRDEELKLRIEKRRRQQPSEPMTPRRAEEIATGQAEWRRRQRVKRAQHPPLDRGPVK